MSPSAVPHATLADQFDDNLQLSIVGLASDYPAFHNGPEALETLAKRHYPESIALSKVLSINRFTGIETRSAIGNADHPIVNQAEPPSIKQLNELFMKEAVQLSVNACRKALNEWGGDSQDITHVVSTTCTNSANPGFDHFVVKELGINRNAEKILLAGIGCSGGMAAMRTAANIALGASYRRKPARVLVLACEICSVFVRSELESIHQNQEIRIGVCLFSDAASACIVSNGVGEDAAARSVYDILGWKHEVIEDSHSDLGFDVDPLGWKVVLTQRVPSLTSTRVSPAFNSLIASIPQLHKDGTMPSAADFDWALHPGGSLIITGVQEAMKLEEQHLRASYEIYMEHGNSSSATIMSVMDRLRQPKHIEAGKENVIACAFGPGINMELIALKRGCKQVNEPLNGQSNGHPHTEVNGLVNGHSSAHTNGQPNEHSNGYLNGISIEPQNGIPSEDLD